MKSEHWRSSRDSERVSQRVLRINQTYAKVGIPGRNGFMSFEFYPQCTKGVIGAVFRFVSEESYMIVEAATTE